MLSGNGDFTIDCESQGAVVRGVLRLPSPTAYDGPFEALRAAVTAATLPFLVDIRAVRFMNSSGITAFSRLVLHARALGKPLVLRGALDVAWQQKTLKSLTRLYGDLQVEFA